MDDAVIKSAVESIVRNLKNTADINNSLSLALAKKLIELIEQKANETGVKAVIAVGDKSGNIIAVHCMDDAFIASYDIAINKVYTSAALKMPTKKLAELASPEGSLYGIQFTNNNRIIIFGGGEPLEKDGIIIGALGVSGGTAKQDTYLGEYGRDKFLELIK